jgi:DNA invertase Pin-like site-specific DNA recombinase
MERELIRERVRAGMARARGQQLGRPHRDRPLSEHSLWPVVVSGLQAGHLNRAEAARKLRVRRVTLDAALGAVRNGGGSEPDAG